MQTSFEPRISFFYVPAAGVGTHTYSIHPTLLGAHATNFEARVVCSRASSIAAVYEPRSYSITAVHSTTTYNPT